MKNYRTPRTLSDGSFSVGYPVAYRKRNGYGPLWWTLVCAAGVFAVVVIALEGK